MSHLASSGVRWLRMLELTAIKDRAASDAASDAAFRFPQVGAPEHESLLLLARHFRLKTPDHAASSNDARKRQRDAEPVMVTADRYHRPLIANNHFRDPCRDDADSKLTGISAFDDGDIGVTHAVLDLLAHLVERFAALLDQSADRDAGDAG